MSKPRKLTDSTIVEVYNNTTGIVSFMAGNKNYKWDRADVPRKVPLGDIRELMYSAGGEKLLRECLLIKDIDVREELGLPIEKEQILDKNDISQLLSNGTTNELESVISITNDGIKDKIVSTAINEQITDTSKMEVIQKHTGIDVYAAIKEKKEQESQTK